MQVTAATPFDLPALRLLMQALVRDEHGAYLPRPIRLTEAAAVTRRMVDASWPAMLLAWAEPERPAGFAWVDRGHLQALYLRPERRGVGGGSRLLTAAADRGIRQGARRLTVDTQVANERARAFYARHGFRPGPVWTDPSWGAPLAMQRFERAVR